MSSFQGWPAQRETTRPPYAVRVVEESRLTPEMRLGVSEVLPPEWFPEDHAQAEEIRARGWMQAEPYARILAFHGPRIIGTTALVDVTTEGSPVSVHGLADVAVRPDYRGQGVGRGVLEWSVAIAQSRGAGVIMAATVVPPVISTLRRAGFRRADPGEFWFSLTDHPGMEERTDAPERPEWIVSKGLVSNKDWWVWTDRPLSGPVRIKQDF